MSFSDCSPVKGLCGYLLRCTMGASHSRAVSFALPYRFDTHIEGVVGSALDRNRTISYPPPQYASNTPTIVIVRHVSDLLQDSKSGCNCGRHYGRNPGNIAECDHTFRDSGSAAVVERSDRRFTGWTRGATRSIITLAPRGNPCFAWRTGSGWKNHPLGRPLPRGHAARRDHHPRGQGRVFLQNAGRSLSLETLVAKCGQCVWAHRPGRVVPEE